MQRTQFTFYESFFKAISRIKKKQDRADAYDMICAYALYQIEPNLESASDAVAIAFELLRPVLDKAKERAESGKKGGSKTEANDKQNESKQEATSKQGKSVSKKEKEKEVEIEKEKEIDNIPPTEVCGELPSSPPPDEPDPSPLSIIVVRLPLVDGTEYPVFERQVEELTALYPAVDVPQQLRNMRGWLLANPKNRKTKSGIMRFANAWLSREQNTARVENGKTMHGQAKPSYDFANDPDQQAAIRRMFGGGQP